MARLTWRAAWPAVKAALAVLIVIGVGWQFYGVLRRPELWAAPPAADPGLVAVSAGLFAAAMLCWGGFWLRLLDRLGGPAPPVAGLKAYFVSQLGKYVPGKAWVIVLRVGYARAAGVPPAVAALAGVYETLAAMAAGALVAAVLLPAVTGRGGEYGWVAVGLLAAAGLPLVPGVFNRVAARAARPFLPPGADPPTVGLGTLARGLLQGVVGWLFVGASLLALLAALGLEPEGPRPLAWLRCTAYAAVAYVAGFLALPAPGGLGVREAILQYLLAGESFAGRPPEAAGGLAALAALALRLVWTSVEVLAAAGFSLVRPAAK